MEKENEVTRTTPSRETMKKCKIMLVSSYEIEVENNYSAKYQYRRRHMAITSVRNIIAHTCTFILAQFTLGSFINAMSLSTRYRLAQSVVEKLFNCAIVPIKKWQALSYVINLACTFDSTAYAQGCYTCAIVLASSQSRVKRNKNSMLIIRRM